MPQQLNNPHNHLSTLICVHLLQQFGNHFKLEECLHCLSKDCIFVDVPNNTQEATSTSNIQATSELSSHFLMLAFDDWSELESEDKTSSSSVPPFGTEAPAQKSKGQTQV